MRKNKIASIIFILSVFFSSSLFSQSKETSLKHFENGVKFQNVEDWFKAREEFLQAVQENPAFGEAWFNLAKVTYETGDFALCFSYIETAEKYAKDRVDILNLKGMCLISLGRLAEARSLFEKVISDYPNNVEARFGLAELELYDGTFDNAEKLYLEALKRQSTNRRALLSLAVLATETGKDEASQNYINQALRYHASQPEVQYLAAYLNAKRGNFKEAERRARASVQLKTDYTDSYLILASILYSQKQYDEVCDICDYLINQNRNNISAWYLKGRAKYKIGKIEDALSIWGEALKIDPNDEILRSALEILVIQNFSLEDENRIQWADYHIKKADEYSKQFKGEQVRYEYQRALKIAPNDFSARIKYANFIGKLGLNELYLNQLNFIKENSKIDRSKLSSEELSQYVSMDDTIEAYSSLMKNSLNSRWDVDSFYLDKTRWNIGLYYTKSPFELIHCDSEEIAARMLCESFTGESKAYVSVREEPVLNYAQAFSLARQNRQDYFIILKFEETQREVTFEATVYNGRNGTQITKFSLFRTGNGKFSSSVRSLRSDILNMLPIRGKILKQSGNNVLLDLGKSDGMVKGTVLDVVKAGGIRTSDTGLGVVVSENDYLAQITIDEVAEEISQGTLQQKSFYDRVNLGDEVLIKDLSSAKEKNVVEDSRPAADKKGKIIENDSKEKLTVETLGLKRVPAFVELIRKIY
ncbi:tetratricopeptide repeat protein [Treponema pectinovorum]|uniref:tetratricopeptide repeat protein n=1 Tax=Treponema pectinovorum TaxID=164 RepID=UPI003D8A5836